MSIPNADRAIVDPAKIRDTLLSAAHPIGRFKAAFLLSLGYSADRWEVLRDHVFALALLRAGEEFPRLVTVIPR